MWPAGPPESKHTAHPAGTRSQEGLRVLSWTPLLLTSPTYHRPRAAPARTPRRPAGLACALACLALGAPAALAAAPAPEALAASTLVIEGAGDGHGVGMSQEGALGLAEHGYTYQQILAHYYTRHHDRRRAGQVGCARARRQEGAARGARTLRARRGLRRDALGLAARGARGAGGGEPHVRAHRARGRRALRRVLRHALAGVRGRRRRNREHQRRRHRHRGADRRRTPANPPSPTSSPAPAA